MKGSRRELSIGMVIGRDVFKYKFFFSCMTLIPKKGMGGLPKTGDGYYCATISGRSDSKASTQSNRNTVDQTYVYKVAVHLM